MTMALSLSVLDYVLFGAMLAISAAIGIYSAFSGGRQQTADEYLLGNRKMHIIPVALSMMVSFISAISVLGLPAEMYMFGTMYWWSIVGNAVGAAIGTLMFAPLFFKLQLTSIYEYLELRFSKTVRVTHMLLFFFQVNFYMGMVMYTPALALNAVTGMSLSASIVSTGLVCIFYTTIGGMKAVLWTDAFQAVVMTIGVMALIVAGVVELGGMGEVWSRAEAGGRLIFTDMRFDLTIRNTFWSVNTGSFLLAFGTFGVNQTIVQRYLCLGSIKKAKWAVFVAILSKWVVVSLMCLSGVVMYAYYADCDPSTSEKVSTADQVMPYMVMEVFATMPGIPGIFLSSVLSASLSTVSSGLNALAAVTGEDIVKKIWPKMSEKAYAASVKGLSLFFGGVAIGVAFFALLMNDQIVTIGISIIGITYGATAATYVLGACSPRISNKGVLIGTIVSIGVMLWLKIGSMLASIKRLDELPLSVEGCTVENTTASLYYAPTGTAEEEGVYSSSLTPTPEPFVDPDRTALETFYSLSVHLYSTFGFSMTIVVSIIASAITGFNDPAKVDERLLINLRDTFCGCLPKKRSLEQSAQKFTSDEGKFKDQEFQRTSLSGTNLHCKEKGLCDEEKVPVIESPADEKVDAVWEATV